MDGDLDEAKTVFRFSEVSPATRRMILDASPSAGTLAWAETQVPALREVECQNPVNSSNGENELRIAAWNLQQCHFPDEAAEAYVRNNIDLALLSEVDVGLRRTRQLHTVRRMCDRIGERSGMRPGYGVGVEFYELLATNGGIHPGAEEENYIGYHCNAWLSSLPASRPAIIRLPSEADWFVNPRRNQRRVGGRMALLATFPFGSSELAACAVHLESDTGPEGRRIQMRALLKGIEGYARDRPVIVGGDFNAGARVPDYDYRVEALFEEAEAMGYDWRSCNDGSATSRHSRIANYVQQNNARYDWFFIRGLSVSSPAVIPAVDGEGKAISDHDAICVTVRAAVQEREHDHEI